MALFGMKSNKDEKKDAPKEAKAVAKKPAKKEVKAVAKKEGAVVAKTSIASSVLLRPHITEKAGVLSGQNVYTFEIHKNANKASVAHAIEEVYKVKPKKVATAQIRSKNKSFRGKAGRTSSGKKAYVYLNEGDKIEFI